MVVVAQSMALLVQSQCRERERERLVGTVLGWFLSPPKLEISRFDICDVIFYFFKKLIKIEKVIFFFN